MKVSGEGDLLKIVLILIVYLFLVMQAFFDMLTSVKTQKPYILATKRGMNIISSL